MPENKEVCTQCGGLCCHFDVRQWENGGYECMHFEDALLTMEQLHIEPIPHEVDTEYDYSCPALSATGCVLTYEQRPVVCSEYVCQKLKDTFPQP